MFYSFIESISQAHHSDLSWFSADHTVGRGGGAVLSKPAEVGGLQSWAGGPGSSRPPAEAGRQDDSTRSFQVPGFQHSDVLGWDVMSVCLSDAGWALNKEVLFPLSALSWAWLSLRKVSVRSV